MFTLQKNDRGKYLIEIQGSTAILTKDQADLEQTLATLRALGNVVQHVYLVYELTETK